MEILVDKIWQLKIKNKYMKQKIGTLLYQQDNQANFMTQEIEKK